MKFNFELDIEYELAKIEQNDMGYLFEVILKKFVNADKLSDEEYHTLILNYLIYANNRDEIGAMNIKYNSSFIGTNTVMATAGFDKNLPGLIFINPDNKSIFEFQSFQKLLTIINCIEHEIAHNFETKYITKSYKKFVNENGKVSTYYASLGKLFKEIFAGSEFEEVANLWVHLTYSMSHREQFARKRAYDNTKAFVYKLIDYALAIGVSKETLSRIIVGYERYGKECVREDVVYEKITKAFFQNKIVKNGKCFEDLKNEWDRFIKALSFDNLHNLGYMTDKKIEMVYQRLPLVIDLCNLKTLFSQENFDNLFSWQMCSPFRSVKCLMKIVCQKRNTKSQGQIGRLKGVLQGFEKQEFEKASKKLFSKEEDLEINVPMHLIEIK
jgi:hypothetical protein